MSTGIALSILALLFGVNTSGLIANNIDSTTGETYQLQNQQPMSVDLEKPLSLSHLPEFYDCDFNSPHSGTNLATFQVKGSNNLKYTFQGNDLLVLGTQGTGRVKQVFEKSPITDEINPKKNLLVFNKEGGFAHISQSIDKEDILLAEIYACQFHSEYGDQPSDFLLKSLVRIDLTDNTATKLSLPVNLPESRWGGAYDFSYSANQNTIQIPPEALNDSLPRVITNYEFSYLDPAIALPAIENLNWPVKCPAQIFNFKKDENPFLGCQTNNNQEVTAILDGKVITATDHDDLLSQWGKYIVIDHGNNLQSIYRNLGKISVTKDQKVKIGDKIGSTDSFQKMKPEFYFATTLRGYYFDPLRLTFKNR